MTRFHGSLVALATSSVLALAGCSSEKPAQGSPSPDVTTSTDRGSTILASGTEALPAGTYVLDLDALTVGAERLPNITITVPDGWSNIEGWGVNTGSKRGDRWMGITFWDVDEVYAHPCQGSRTIQPGPTVADLAKGLAKQPLRDATEAVDVVIDGIQGLQLEWSVPADFDFSTCGDGYFDSWTAASGSWNGGRYQQGPGQVDRLWILDVDGERLVVDAMYMPSADAMDRHELWQVVESIGFET
jgi:hypothetical protein